MAKRTFAAGAASQTIDVFIQDTTKTDGSGLSGLVFNSSGLKAYYRKGATGTPTAITLVTQTVGGAWSSGGFVELDATNMKGAYRLDVPDTVLASSPYATIYLYGATNMAVSLSELEVVAYNPFDAVRLGLTALPNAVAAAIGGLLTAPTTANVGLADLSRILGTALTETAGQIAGAFKKWFDVAAPVGTVNSIPNATAGAAGGLFIAGTNAATAITTALTTTFTGNLTGSVGSVTGNVGGNVTGSVGSVAGAVGSVTGNVGGNVTGSVGSVAAGGITAASFAAAALDAVWSTATRLLTAGTNIVLAKGTGVTGFNDVSTAQVKTQVVDALATDTYAEPGQGAPAATATLADKIGYLYKGWRNKKTQTSTVGSLYADDGATVDQKFTVSDDGTTATRGEVAAGP